MFLAVSSGLNSYLKLRFFQRVILSVKEPLCETAIKPVFLCQVFRKIRDEAAEPDFVDSEFPILAP